MQTVQSYTYMIVQMNEQKVELPTYQVLEGAVLQQVSPNRHLARFFVDFEEVRSWHDANKFVAQFALKRKQLTLSV